MLLLGMVLLLLSLNITADLFLLLFKLVVSCRFLFVSHTRYEVEKNGNGLIRRGVKRVFENFSTIFSVERILMCRVAFLYFAQKNMLRSQT